MDYNELKQIVESHGCILDKIDTSISKQTLYIYYPEDKVFEEYSDCFSDPTVNRVFATVVIQKNSVTELYEYLYLAADKNSKIFFTDRHEKFQNSNITKKHVNMMCKIAKRKVFEKKKQFKMKMLEKDFV